MPRIVLLALAVSFGVLACNQGEDSDTTEDGGVDDGGVDDGGVDDGGTGNDACSYVSDFDVGFDSIDCDETTVAVGQTVTCSGVAVGGEQACVALANLADSTTGGSGCADQGDGAFTITVDTALATAGEYVVAWTVFAEAGTVTYGLPGDDSNLYELLLFPGDEVIPEFAGPVGEECSYITVTITDP